MDCYYHDAVPSVAACVACKEPICATCRSTYGDCPGCRLAARIDSAAGGRELPGAVPRRKRAAPPPEQPAPPSPQPHYAPVQQRREVMNVRPESRALVALGYPFWPLALLALLDGSGSPYVRRQAFQALGFNFGIYGFGLALSAIATIPLLGLSAWPLLALIVPVSIVVSIVYALKVWHGDDVRVPIIADVIDARLPTSE